MISKQELFPINILRIKYPDAHLLNADQDIENFFNEHNESMNVQEFVGAIESSLFIKNYHDVALKSFEPLKDWILTIKNQLWEALGFQDSLLTIERSWINRSTKSNTTVPSHLWPHVHGSTDMVCTYYYKYPDGSAPIRFHNPMEVQIGMTPMYTSSTIVYPEEGELLVWPGWLWHSVDAHEVPANRVVVGFNINQQSFSINNKWVRVAT